jgi:hypothetical protein
MINRKRLAGVLLFATMSAVIALVGLPMIYGFLIMAGWIDR